MDKPILDPKLVARDLKNYAHTFKGWGQCDVGDIDVISVLRDAVAYLDYCAKGSMVEKNDKLIQAKFAPHDVVKGDAYGLTFEKGRVLRVIWDGQDTKLTYTVEFAYDNQIRTHDFYEEELQLLGK